MAQLFQKAKDLHVVATYIYKKSGDDFAYSDAAFTTKIAAADLKEMFEKGAIIVDTDEYKPVFYAAAAAGGTIVYVKANTTTATTAVLTSLKSSDYSAT